VRVVQATSSVLRDAGIPPDQVPRLERMVSTFLLGYATAAANAAFWSDIAATSPPAEPPGSRAARTDGAHWRGELDRDVADLTHLLRGLAGAQRPDDGR
jgi:hypothetical protein